MHNDDTTTAQVLAFDDGSLEAQLAGPDRGNITAGTGSDNDDVERFGGHCFLPEKK